MKKNFLAGFAILFPLLITYEIVRYCIGLLTAPFDKFMEELFHTLHLFRDDGKEIIHLFSIVSILLLLTLFIFCIGVIVYRSGAQFADRLIKKIPLINTLYSTCKGLIEAFLSPKAKSFERVVLVPYPTKDQLGIGLVTQEFINTLRPELEKEFVTVLIPCAPNPMVGFLCAFPKKSVIPSDMSVDQAMKYILSCGLKKPLEEIPTV